MKTQNFMETDKKTYNKGSKGYAVENQELLNKRIWQHLVTNGHDW